MFSLFIKTLLAALAGFIRDVLADRKRDADLKQLGAAEAALDTQKSISEVADAQRENDGGDRGGAGDVARRVRERLAKRAGDRAG